MNCKVDCKAECENNSQSSGTLLSHRIKLYKMSNIN